MATYLVTEEINITRQEGDTADLEFTVPVADFDMTGITEVKFHVKNGSKKLIDKSVGAGTITVDGQTVSMDFASADTTGYSGQHRWELEVSNETESYTLGQGNFTIKRTII